MFRKAEEKNERFNKNGTAHEEQEGSLSLVSKNVFLLLLLHPPHEEVLSSLVFFSCNLKRGVLAELARNLLKQ